MTLVVSLYCFTVDIKTLMPLTKLHIEVLVG